MTKKILFGLVVTLLVCTTTIVAQDADKGKKKKKDPTKKTTAAMMKSFKKAKLTEEQQASAKAIIEKHLASYMEAKKTADSLFSKDQLALQKAAMKKGRADVLKGKNKKAKGDKGKKKKDKQNKKKDGAKELALAAQTVSLKVPNMTCSGCAASVQAALAAVDGVTDVETNVENLTCSFNASESLDVGTTLNKIVEGGNSQLKDWTLAK